MKHLLRRVVLALALLLLGACGDDDGAGTGPPPRADSVTSVIGSAGGSLVVDGVATVTFPAGAVNGAPVTVQRTVSAEYAAGLTQTAGLFHDGIVQAPHQVVIDVEGVQPAADVEVTVVVPAAVRATAPPNAELRVLYTLFQVSAEERDETVEMLPARFAATAESATVTLPPEAFSTEGSGSASRRAVLYIAYTRTGTGAVAAARYPHAPAAIDDGTCGAVSLDYPLDAQAPVQSKFGRRKHPITGEWSGHAGLDLTVGTGTPVRAMADGVVKKVGYQYNATRKTGWGYFVALQHGTATTLYAHLLENGRVTEGQTVTAGQQIAMSNTSGGATGPHLHVEYGPKGEWYDSDAKVDPTPCFGRQTNGSISVGDNGPAADDAFRVTVDGAFICQTQIGQSNNCSLGRLRTGTYTLTVQCTVAPDNLGTLGIALANGFTFEGGGTTLSDELDEGESRSYRIVAP